MFCISLYNESTLQSTIFFFELLKDKNSALIYDVYVTLTFDASHATEALQKAPFFPFFFVSLMLRSYWS